MTKTALPAYLRFIHRRVREKTNHKSQQQSITGWSDEIATGWRAGDSHEWPDDCHKMGCMT